MLFLESKTLRHGVDGNGRIELLEGLQQKGLTSIIRAARLHGFRSSVVGSRANQGDGNLARCVDRSLKIGILTSEEICLQAAIMSSF